MIAIWGVGKVVCGTRSMSNSDLGEQGYNGKLKESWEEAEGRKERGQEGRKEGRREGGKEEVFHSLVFGVR